MGRVYRGPVVTAASQEEGISRQLPVRRRHIFVPLHAISTCNVFGPSRRAET